MVRLLILLSYPTGLKHRAFEALAAGVVSGHPLASATCCSGIPSNVTTTTISTRSLDMGIPI
jgi:hypothetical protein